MPYSQPDDMSAQLPQLLGMIYDKEARILTYHKTFVQRRIASVTSTRDYASLLRNAADINATLDTSTSEPCSNLCMRRRIRILAAVGTVILILTVVAVIVTLMLTGTLDSPILP